MRLLLAVALTAVGLAVAPVTSAVPGVCPPACDSIPDSAWPVSSRLPLYPQYRWPGLAGLAVSPSSPRFAYEKLCRVAPVRDDPREYAVSARAEVDNGPGQWRLQVQILHWRGPVSDSGPLVTAMLDTASWQLRLCPVPGVSPSLTTMDAERVAAVISVADDQVMHYYLLADPSNGTIVELALSATLPVAVPWPTVSDVDVFDALGAPLCQAYLGSCR
ncbi:ATPase [Mycolicibacterium phlei]|uniref:ATPase n=1 Tax=Mycolicibacterium phlei DSM 43239 = CCUG 21000 TaxID=1226750 RepID=A0A5N5UUU8_MYCPH|nr:hypothetical protein [Mycolicibacterium phlei]VEG07650.1 ATPase [Mycobacteroides chelonae]AMO59520.1 hypothetical protein MPHLCCUG_00683 [Mycolicibacterium phlei]KAB7753355.1 hypothetical protein MPHL21000_19105 [Mycolicibacterium phlei DSM 43239 = CCUG 21000]KXW62258.1 hypothetical protein MPHL43239_18170 [Mycolicibacterium phlei DSM 43239 = CCUG 21000]KXW67381.1 hypothetical protein MPHL43070_20085 [Mycolicibacterium phlei DSM 43070]